MTKLKELSKALDNAFDGVTIARKEAMIEFCDILDAIVDNTLRQHYIDKAFLKLTEQTNKKPVHNFTDQIANAWFFLGLMYERKLLPSSQMARKLEMAANATNDLEAGPASPEVTIVSGAQVAEPVELEELFSSDANDIDAEYAIEKAHECYENAKELGHLFATYRSAALYEHGIGVDHRYDIAAQLYQQALADPQLERAARAKLEYLKAPSPGLWEDKKTHVWLDDISQSSNKRALIEPILKMQQDEITRRAQAKAQLDGLISSILSGSATSLYRFEKLIHSPEFAFTKSESIDELLRKITELYFNGDSYYKSHAAFCRGYFFEAQLTETAAMKAQLEKIEHRTNQSSTTLDRDDDSIDSTNMVDHDHSTEEDDEDERREKTIDWYREAIRLDNNPFAIIRLMQIYQAGIVDLSGEVVTDGKKEFAKLEVLLESLRSFTPQLTKLFKSLDEMMAYGKKLELSGATAKGTMVQKHAMGLKIKLYEFMINMINPHDKTMEDIKQFELDFIQTLHSKNNEMKDHRAMWKLVFNVLLAFTVVGFVALFAKALIVLATSNEDNSHLLNKFGFWGRTHSENLNYKVEHEFDNCFIKEVEGP